MTFDTKRLKTCKWLEKIATSKARIMSRKPAFNTFNRVYTIYGRLYATNNYILAEISYPEFEHISDEGWLQVESWFEESGNLAPLPKLIEVQRENPMRERLFSDMFANTIHYEQSCKWDPYLIAEAMQPFKINDIAPNMYFNNEKLCLAGHNKDVSIRVLLVARER